MPISNITNAISSVKSALGNILPKGAGTTTNAPSIRDGVSIGTGVGKSQVQQFHDFLLTDVGNIPLSTQWVLQIDTLPAALDSNISSPEVKNLEPGDWFTSRRAQTLRKAIAGGVFMDKGVCVFAQGVGTPQEMFNVETVGPNSGFQGGLLGAPVSTGRSSLPPLNIAFLETNYSFLDFIIRPWIIYASHYGLVARQPSDPKNVKTTLQLFYYDRGGRDRPRIRKIFKFYNAVPTRVEGIISTWDQNEARNIYTSWSYSHYSVMAEDIEDALNDIRKTAATNRFISSAKESFSTPIALTPIPPLASSQLGSEAASNPLGYKGDSEFDKFKPTNSLPSFDNTFSTFGSTKGGGG